ncbi:homocysteine S-methyltransferase family protein [Clostridium sp.]|uniref:homocysteine S-methyltransferase family protein n=1 Tax=Clostridium sp. TaxID=1506 RepID=UPI00261247A4|nr:homocysteine S-methyltransferase family protein [Clostridium sp.]
MLKNKIDLNREFLIGDGAMGTRLMELGVDLRKNSVETLNLNNPELIEKVHKEYVEAGSNIILSNTFMCNIINEKKNNYKLEEVVEKALSIGRKVCKDETFLALDIGPLSYYMNNEDGSFKKIIEDNTERIIKAGKDNFDLVIFETFGSLEESKIAIKKAKELTFKPIICSFTLAGKINVKCFLEDVCLNLNNSGISALGINCTEYSKVLEGIKVFKKNTKLPIMIKPNLGIPKREGEKLKYSQEIREFKEFSKKAKELGVKIIGGCCGTTKDYIESIKNI